MANEVAFLPEYIFVSYDGVIKNYRIRLLQYILDNFKDKYRNFINIDLLEKLSTVQLNGLCTQSYSSNILEYIALREFNWTQALIDIYPLNLNLYNESELLVMGNTIKTLLQQSFTKKIYIWTPTFDKRIHIDLCNIYENNTNIEYITGSFCEVINSIEDKITAYFIDNIELVDMLIAIDKISYSNVLLANYGYNYKLDEKTKMAVLNINNLEDKMADKIFKMRTFIPFNKYEIISR